MTSQHSTFKNNDDFHSFTRETKRSLMQRVQQRLIIIVLMFCTIVFMIRIYLFQSHHSTSTILATDVSPRGVEDRLTFVANMVNVKSYDFRCDFHCQLVVSKRFECSNPSQLFLYNFSYKHRSPFIEEH